MEFDHLKGFYLVAKFGSFTEAAEHLYVSQPAISLQVKALEKELGEQLFDRIGRSIKLTYAGKVLYKEARELVGKLDEIQRIVEELKSLESGRLAVGASDTLSIHFLPELLKAFRQEYPKIELRIVSLVSKEVVRKVKDRELDLGIVTLPFAEPRLEVRPAFEQRLVCIVHPEHRLASRKLLDIRQLASEPLILLEETSLTRQRVQDCLVRHGCECRPIMELSNFEIIKRYVAAGLGVSLVPQGAVSSERDGVHVIRLKQRVCLAVGIVLFRERRLSRPASEFLNMAADFFGTLSRGESRKNAPANN